MQNIAVFYGGKSVEHEVSIITALQVMDNINQEKFKVFPVYIDHDGVWWKLKKHLKKISYKNLKKSKKQKISIKFGKNSLFYGNFFKKEVKIDAVINCCHGSEGENGCLQGVFEMLNLPYSSAGVMASAICMNKVVMKQLFEKYGFNITKWAYFKKETQIDFNQILKDFEFPIFVKPANLGSSVGISKCENLKQLKFAIEVAFGFDDLIILEEGVTNLMEINCSVQIVNKEILTSELEVPLNWENFLTYENKYVLKNKEENKTSACKKLNKSLKKNVENLSVKAYQDFFLEGVIRIDFLYNKKTKQLFINEINTIPGSLSFYLWKAKGLSFSNHITNLIETAQIKAKQKQGKITKIKSPLLDL